MVDAVDKEDMFKELAKFKPICKLFNTSVGCSYARKCKNRHCKGEGKEDAPTSVANTAYYMDVLTDENGNQVLVPRTPFKEALRAFFVENGTVVLGRQAGSMCI
jgi:hypothetical protein